MKITENIYYVGVNDHEVDLFEGEYTVPGGISYNSYVIMDESVAVMDTVDGHFGKQWMENLGKALQGRTPDYLVIQHMEPDHSASIPLFMEKYPDAVIVATPAAFKMMKQFFGEGFTGRQLPAANGGELSLGQHTLQFLFAPMVHWPEVMMTYEKEEKILFSADGFGKFGALDVEEAWDDEARRYYIGIVGKYGAQVQNVLKKAAALDIRMICALHGPVLKENLSHYIGLYDTWSSYRPEKKGVAIAYASVYGNTKAAALYLAEKLKEKGVQTALYDLARTDLSFPLADAFCYDRLVLACNTYNAGIHPMMSDFITRLREHAYQKRTVAFVENGSWAPMAAKGMRAALEGCKELNFVEPAVTVLSAMTEENKEQLNKLAETLGF
jgi:uncharacterized flavoproteins